MLQYKIPLSLWGAEPAVLLLQVVFNGELFGLPSNKRRQTLQKGHFNVYLKSNWYFHTASLYHRAAVVQPSYTDTQKFCTEFEGWPATGMQLVLCGESSRRGHCITASGCHRKFLPSTAALCKQVAWTGAVNDVAISMFWLQRHQPPSATFCGAKVAFSEAIPNRIQDAVNNSCLPL